MRFFEKGINIGFLVFFSVMAFLSGLRDMTWIATLFMGALIVFIIGGWMTESTCDTCKYKRKFVKDFEERTGRDYLD